MTKHKKTRKNRQRGGFWPFTSNTNTYPTQSWSEWFNNWGNKTKNTTTSFLNNANEAIGNTASNASNMVQNAIGSVQQIGNSDISLYDANNANQNNANQNNMNNMNQNNVNNMNAQQGIEMGTMQPNVGGKKRRMRGGSNLAYTAAPVSGLKVAGPNTWQYYANGTNQYSTKGGSRKRRNKKTRKARKHKK